MSVEYTIIVYAERRRGRQWGECGILDECLQRGSEAMGRVLNT